MEIYFDDKLIDEDYYTGLSTNFTLFGDTFYLGSTASNNYNLSIDKEAITSHPNIVTVKNEGTLVATLVVDEVEENDFEYRYTLTDQMLNLEFKYDASELMSNGGATLLKIAQDICNKAGIELATMNFRGYNKSINWYDNTRTAREYIGYIAELNGGYAQIGKDGKLYFLKQNEPSVKTISIEDCSDFEIGEKHVITRVVYEQGTLKYEYGDETGNTLYLNGDNVYITEQSEVEEIFNEINGFEFYSFSTNNCPIDYNIMAGQIITFTDGINDYPVIAGYEELTFNGDWYGGYKLDVATKKQEETQVIGTSEKIKNLSIKVDRGTNTITQVIKEVDTQNQKISKVEQTVNELNSKITEVADLTTSAESIYAKVSLDNINESEPIYIKIYPVITSISYLYPRDNLYPSDDLFPTIRTLRFTNTATNEYVDYELPANLLYYDSGNYDEFILDYDSQSVVVNKRVGYNADGTTYVLESPTTLEFDFPNITLTNGNYTVELLTYETAYLFVRLMVQNIYTTQFATKAEVNSQINQTSQSIELSVDKKLENYPTNTEMNSVINIEANKITSNVSETYSTKIETQNAKQEAIDTANQDTNEKLEDYSTTVEMNSAITQKADQITLETNKKIESCALDNFIVNGNFNNSLNNWDYDGSVFVVEKNNFKYCNLQARTTKSVLTQYISSGGFFANVKYTLTFNVFDELTDLTITGNGIVRVEIYAATEYSEETIEVVTQDIYVSKEEETITIEFTMPENLDELIVTFSLIPNSGVTKTLSLMFGNIVLKSSNINESFAKLNIGVNEISSTVSQKVGNDEVISKINQSAEQIQINANKISLERKRNKFDSK